MSDAAEGAGTEVEALRRQLQAAEEREAAVSELLESIARSTFDLDSLLQTVIDRAVRLCEADTGNIARHDGDVFRVVAFTRSPADYEELVRRRVYVPERGSVIGRTLLERRVVQIEDVLQDAEYALTELQAVGGYRSLLAAPMLRDGEAIGAIAVARNEVRPFTDAEVRLLSTFADEVVLAIETIRLFRTVEHQREELARYAPEVATLLATEEGQRLLAGHRREITALFSDLRGFTAFAETAEPEEVLGVLRDYYAAAGEVITANGGSVEQFAGDGLMAFFNDPVPAQDHELAAVRSAVEMRERFDALAERWRKRGYELGLGVGVASGYATLGRVGFEGRYDYAAIGTVVNLAARLSDVAGPGEILLSQPVHAAVEDHVRTEPPRELHLKGFSRSTVAFQVIGLGA
ncbi:MAG TPA: adenylate/guanylate cyclase domain-containing protein [Actinomycetota bacterium]|nr:adenylate/guanylate cyclase domain-containing protein [Actinomycetota bacterium]